MNTEQRGLSGFLKLTPSSPNQQEGGPWGRMLWSVTHGLAPRCPARWQAHPCEGQAAAGRDHSAGAKLPGVLKAKCPQEGRRARLRVRGPRRTGRRKSARPPRETRSEVLTQEDSHQDGSCYVTFTTCQHCVQLTLTLTVPCEEDVILPPI